MKKTKWFDFTVVLIMLNFMVLNSYAQVTVTLPPPCGCPNGIEPSTNGTGIVPFYGGVGCTGSGTISGTMTQGVAVSGVTMTLYANVTQIGSWSLSATNNGVTFSGSGTFTTLGCQAITLTAAGTPTAAGSFTWATNSTPASSVTATVVAVGTITGIDCIVTTNNGTLTSGTAASSVSSVISYTGGNGGTYSGQTVASTGVTGLTATLTAGLFATGAGSLTYTITGTPAASGTATFAINIGGQTCTLIRNVNYIIPSTITLSQNKTYFIASVFDQDYLPYSIPTGPATTNSQAANGVNESVTIDVQGSITTTGVTLALPVTATGSGNLGAYSNTITIPASMTSDGISRDLVLSWASQAYTSTTTFISINIAAIGGTLNAKKLDINAGLGNDILGVLLGTFTYPYNSAGNMTNYNIRDISAIPDRNIGDPNHVMFYLPVTAPDGNIWLNNNLGAAYSNTTSASFNPAQQATGNNDYKAYGSLFQGGRYSDGHELINWTGSSSPNFINGTTTTQATTDTPGHSLFINSGVYIQLFNWRNPANNNLWSTVSGNNNPCPIGFRLPLQLEFQNLIVMTGIINTGDMYPKSGYLKLIPAGYRHPQNASWYDGYGVGNEAFFWAYSYNRPIHYSGGIGNIFGSMSAQSAMGASVRCIKE